ASGLKLADGWLTAREVYNLRIGAGLVTLSGCDTGRSVIGSGDELIGLMRGFFAAGASSVVMSLWTVNDDSTADLMTAFYNEWRDGASAVSALRTAQLRGLDARRHPAFWAPFLLGGKLG
ncbi:MAG: CHAT domain-containing protein, partial [Chloroflexota bacterium]|nr:CHAT domain-containing protein [Chloroflexota bacterium]